MSKYTTEQVESAAEIIKQDQNAPSWKRLSEMLAVYTALLREREAAKAGVTDEMVRRADAAQREFFESTPFTGDRDRLTSVRATLEAVAPMLVSAREPDGLLQLIRDARHRICNDAESGLNASPFANPVYGPPLRRLDAMDAMLVAASKPEKE